MKGQPVESPEHVHDQPRSFRHGYAVGEIARVSFRYRRLQQAVAEVVTGGDGDVLIPTRTFVELEAGVRIDLGERCFLRDVPKGYAKIGVADCFADDQLIGM